jgi:hypothetical protein
MIKQPDRPMIVCSEMGLIKVSSDEGLRGGRVLKRTSRAISADMTSEIRRSASAVAGAGPTRSAAPSGFGQTTNWL